MPPKNLNIRSYLVPYGIPATRDGLNMMMLTCSNPVATLHNIYTPDVPRPPTPFICKLAWVETGICLIEENNNNLVYTNLHRRGLAS